VAVIKRFILKTPNTSHKGKKGFMVKISVPSSSYTSINHNTPKRSIFWVFLLFWFLTGLTQLLLALYGAASFEGFKDATITTLFWLLPIIIFSPYAKKLSAGLALIIWLTALPGIGYFFNI
jgi:hypothetical protein